MFQQVIYLKKNKSANSTTCFQPAHPETSQPSPPISVFSHFSVCSSCFPSCRLQGGLLSMTSSLSTRARARWPGVHSRCSSSLTLKGIPTKILRRGVESWTVTAVYFCHIHHQDGNHKKKKKRRRKRPHLPFRRGSYYNWILGLTENWNTVFPFPHMNGWLAIGPWQQFLKWSFLPALSGHRLTNERMWNTWKNQQLIRRATRIYKAHMEVRAEEKLTRPCVLFGGTCHQTRVQSLIKKAK